MSKSPSRRAQRNLLFAGVGIALGMLNRDRVIRAFTEWLLDKNQDLGDILVQQNTIGSDQKRVIDEAVDAQIQQEGGEAQALASLRHVNDLDSDLGHLRDSDIGQAMIGAKDSQSRAGNRGNLFGSWEDVFSKSTIGADDFPDFIQPEGRRIPGSYSGGRETGRFYRESLLDSGALGEVWVARDAELNRTVVVKYIKPDQAKNPLQRALFHLEGEVTGYLEHPNIAPVYGLGMDGKDRCYYAMRYIQGRKLTRAISEYHAIDSRDSGRKQETLIGLLQGFQSACMAVEYAHSRGVIHCDLKPDNIMVGQFGETMVVDWGLVMVKGGLNSSPEEPQAKGISGDAGLKGGLYRPSSVASGGLHKNQGGMRNTVGGTFAYMGPEQLRATLHGMVEEVTVGSDIFALGATLYHLLTNHAPLVPDKSKKETSREYHERVAKAIFPKPRAVKKEIARPLEGIVLKAMAANPGDRYASARELADDVKRWVSDEPVNGYRENLVEKTRRWMRKHRAVMGVLAVLVICAMMGSVGYGVITQAHNDQLKISESKAVNNEKRAVIEKERALAQQELSESRLYINQIQGAHAEWDNGDTKIAFEKLLSTPFQRRGWEHAYLTTLMNEDHVTLKGHKDFVSSVGFSPDGKRVVSGSYDKTIKVWDSTTGQELPQANMGHNSWVHSVGFSPDGKQIVSGSFDKTLKLWEASEGKEIARKDWSHSGLVSAVGFSPDGKRVVSGSYDKSLILWDAITGKKIRALTGHTDIVTSVAFSPDGKQIASGSFDKTVLLWDGLTGDKIAFKGPQHSDWITCVAFSPDGKRIVSGSRDKILKTWDVATGKELETLRGHTDRVTSVGFRPDGKRVVSASYDKTLKIWDADTGEELETLKGHTDWVDSVNYSPDGRRIVSGSRDKTLKIWNVANNRSGEILEGHSDWVDCVAFSPDGKSIVSGSSDKSLVLWDVGRGAKKAKWEGHTDWVLSVGFHPNGNLVVSGSRDKTVIVWDVPTGKKTSALKGHTGSVSCVGFSPDGKRMVSGSLDKTLILWDAVTGKKTVVLEGHTDGVSSVGFSPDGKRMVSGSRDKSLRIWEVGTGNVLKLINGAHGQMVTSVGFTADGKRIVSASMDKTLKLWDATSGKELDTWRGHTEGVTGFAISSDGKRIVSTSLDKTLRLWDVGTGHEIDTLKVQNGGIRSVGFSPDGKRIVSGSSDRTLKLWDATSPQEVHVLNSHLQDISRVGFSTDGKRILGKGVGNQFKVWEIASGLEIPDPDPENQTKDEVPARTISQDGTWSLEVEDSRIVLVNNRLRRERMERDRSNLLQWSRDDSSWHLGQAAEAEKSGNWFAALFHLKKLVELDPGSAELIKRLDLARAKLGLSGKP